VRVISLDDFLIQSEDGVVLGQGHRGEHWVVSLLRSRPAEKVYRLSFASFSDRGRAETWAESLSSAGHEAMVQEIGKRLTSRRHTLVDNRRYRVVLKQVFSSEKDATAFSKTIPQSATVVPSVLNEPAGILSLANLDGTDRIESRRAVRLVGTRVTLQEVEVGRGFHWESKEPRTYPPELEFRLGSDGKITVVNVVPLETYLHGVVPSEMPVHFPLEALKAQAVAARTEVLSRYGLRHLEAPYDLCDDVHCQVYRGLSKTSEATDAAVKETRGLVLSYQGQLAEVYYAAVCGGHTENVEMAWPDREPRPYLRGVLDAPAPDLRWWGSRLSREDQVKQWVENTPDVNCNTLRNDLPEVFDYTKKYFRWQVRYERPELEAIIRSKTGQDLGALREIMPLRRGVSGRVTAIEIRGTRKTITIDGELPIRQTLARTALYSSCFIVEKEGPPGQVPLAFVFQGAGWGHGVGMCQTGAGVMAQRGKKFDDILRHYYEGVELTSVYESS